MYKRLDFKGVHQYSSGVALSPREHGDALIPSTDWPSLSAPDTTDISKLREDPLIACTRYSRGVWDASFNLVGAHLGARQRSITVGRGWSFNHGAFRPSYAEGAGWGNTPVALAPAIAGLASMELEQGSMTSWQSLHTLMGVNPAGAPVQRDLLTDLVKVQGATTNSVRFLHRLAAMYWHAAIGGSDGPVDVEIRSPAYATHHGTVTSLSVDVQRGLAGTQFIPWSDPGAGDVSQVTSVLWAAAAGKLTAIGPTQTRFLKCWPSLGPGVTLILNDGVMSSTLATVSRVTLDARTIWFTALRWAAKYSSIELFEEAVRFVGALCISPAEGCTPCISTKVQIALPPANMGAFAVGGLLEPRTRLSLAACPKPVPTWCHVEEAYLRALVFGLMMWHERYSVVGWYWRHGLTDDGDAQEYCRRFGRWSDQVGAWCSVNHNVHNYLGGDVGRLWSCVMIQEATPWKTCGYWGARAPQWEEIVNRMPKIPSDASIYGMLYPLCAERADFSRNLWAKAGEFSKARSLSHVFYGIAELAPGVETALLLQRSLAVSTVGVTPYQSYRGVVGDFVFQQGIGKDGVEFTPVFRVRDRDEFFFLTDSQSPRFKWEWYVEKSGAEFTDEQTGYSGVLEPPVGPRPRDGEEPTNEESDVSTDLEDLDEVSDVESAGPATQPDDQEQTSLPRTPPKNSSPGAWKEYLVSLRERDSPLGNYLKAADDAKSPAGKEGLRFELLLRRGVSPELVAAFAALRSYGVPDISSEGMEAEMRAVHEFDVYSELKRVAPNRRGLVINDLIEQLVHVLRAMPPSSSARVVSAKLQGAMAMRLALADCSALDGQELWDALNEKGRAALRVEGAARKGQRTGTTYYPTYESLSDVARGRIPDEAVSRKLLFGGMPLSSGFGASAAAAVQTALEHPAMALDDVEMLIETLIKSAWEADVEPDMDMIGELVADTHKAAADFEKLRAAREATEQGFQDTGRNGKGKGVVKQVEVPVDWRQNILDAPGPSQRPPALLELERTYEQETQPSVGAPADAPGGMMEHGGSGPPLADPSLSAAARDAGPESSGQLLGQAIDVGPGIHTHEGDTPVATSSTQPGVGPAADLQSGMPPHGDVDKMTQAGASTLDVGQASQPQPGTTTASGGAPAASSRRRTGARVREGPAIIPREVRFRD